MVVAAKAEEKPATPADKKGDEKTGKGAPKKEEEMVLLGIC